MADIEIVKEHSFDFETARGKAKEWLAKVKEKFGLEFDYVEGEEEDRIEFDEKGVKGFASVNAQEVRFEADLSFIAKPLKKPIIDTVQGGLDRFFA